MICFLVEGENLFLGEKKTFLNNWAILNNPDLFSSNLA